MQVALFQPQLPLSLLKVSNYARTLHNLNHCSEHHGRRRP